MNLSILVRCSDDIRLIRCLDSIDVPCQVVVAITPNPELQKELEMRGITYALSPKGNPAATTLAGLKYCHSSNVLLIDCDCVFLPGAIKRMYALAQSADIVRPSIEFEATDLSSYATRLARDFQYTYFGFIYEPGLLLKLNHVLPLIGGYLFTPFAPFTPDGELDYRLRQVKISKELKIATDCERTLIHAALSFTKHLLSYWRYGFSEASRMVYLKQPVFFSVIAGMAYRYRMAWSHRYPFPTGILIAICDICYITSMLVHLLAFIFRRNREYGFRQ
jgi:glycosyltransferase involved in cell wall biosynthesis